MCLPFDPGVPKNIQSAILLTQRHPDGEIIVDTGAGRGIKPTTIGLVNPVPSNSRITWGDGTSTGSVIEATLPNHELPPFLVTPKAVGTLVSPGANLDGTDDCYSFFDKHGFKISGLQVYKDKTGKLGAKFVGPEESRVKYIATKPRAGDVYKAPNLSVFKQGVNGAERFDTPTTQSINIIAGPGSNVKPAVFASRAAVQSIFTCMTATQKSLIHRALESPDYVCACEYTVADLNASQERMAMQLIQKHNSLGHISREALRCVLQQSHIKTERELARHVHLMPICNSCLDGKNKKGRKHKLTTATPAEPAKFMQNVAIDNQGKQNVMSYDGYWIPFFIICKRTSYTWALFLVTTSDSVKKFERWLKDVAKQHKTFVVKTCRHDGGRGDFGNKAFGKLLRKYDITREQTSGTSTNNAKVERRIGISTADSLTIMIWSQAPRNWWSCAIRYGVVTRNLTPTTTNPGRMSPYEAAYQRKPDYNMLVPFGCLAFAVVENKNMNGKMNYRKASRTCVMIDYTLKPDGHPLGYILYDCDLGTIIKRTTDLVTFNKDMPALKHIAERSVKRPVDVYKNAVVAKFFNKTLHWGKVVSNRIDKDSELLFRVNYEDGDWEELNVTEMMLHSRLARIHDRGHDFTVPCAPKSRKKRLLSKLLQHAKSVNNNSNDDGGPQLSKLIANTKTRKPRRLSKAVAGDSNIVVNNAHSAPVVDGVSNMSENEPLPPLFPMSDPPLNESWFT